MLFLHSSLSFPWYKSQFQFSGWNINLSEKKLRDSKDFPGKKMGLLFLQETWSGADSAVFLRIIWFFLKDQGIKNLKCAKKTIYKHIRVVYNDGVVAYKMHRHLF